jgi:type II secretory pathway component PulF
MKLVQFFRQMAVLIRAGVPIVAALDNCRHVCEPARVLSEHVRGGIRLSRAMLLTGRPFTSLHAAVIEAGESSGRLVEALEQLAEREEAENRVLRRVSSALAYPCLVIGFSGLGVGVLLKFLLPVLLSLGKMTGHPPSLAVRVLAEFDDPGCLLAMAVCLACCGLLLMHLLQRPLVRFALERIKLRVPILRIRSQVILCHSLSSLLRTGLPLVDTLRLAGACVGNRALEAELRDTVDHVRAGEPLSQALRGITLLPRSFAGVVAMGEQCGRLESALSSLGQLYEWELDLAIERFVKTLEPLSVFAVGLVVLSLMLLAFQPIYELMRTL